MPDMPSGDMWYLQDTDPNSQHYGKRFPFNFSFISQPLIKDIVKKYVWYETREGNIVLSSADAILSKFKPFEQFAKIHGYTTLLLPNKDVELFKSYLATALSLKGIPYSRQFQRSSFQSLKAVIRFGQRKQMYHVVPRVEIFTENNYRKINKKLIYDYIPDDVVEQIMKALPEEKNIYVKCGVRIMNGTGMRVGDLLRLKVNRIGDHPIDKAPTLRYFMHKTRKNKTQKIPVFVIQSIKELEEYTASLRQEASDEDKDYLFLFKTDQTNGSRIKGRVYNIGEDLFTVWLHRFCLNNQIKGSDGDIYKLKNHQFRRTLGTDMLSKGASVKTVAKVLGIAPANATKYYATVKDKELATTFSGVVIGNVKNVDEKIIPNAEELEWFHKNKHKGACMDDGYCSQPFKSNAEICERLKSKWACYKCSRYITTLEHFEFHKRNLVVIEDEMEFNPYGEHYTAHLRPIAVLIRQIIDRLEGLKN